MAIRGIIGAFSKNKSPHLISDEALMDWYDNIHIPDVIATSGVKTALRFDSLSEGAEWPWLVVYPVQDILFSETDEFDQIPKGGHEEILHRQFPDLAALDLRISERVSVFQAPTAKKGKSVPCWPDSSGRHIVDTHRAVEVCAGRVHISPKHPGRGLQSLV